MDKEQNHHDPVKAAATIDNILKSQVQWENLWFYQKTVSLYQLTYTFCRRFLPRYGDRTVDQMVQAARSGKQNIVEGLADGVTSTEMEIKLLNVARASVKELREDYIDYLLSRGKKRWLQGHPRYEPLIRFCRHHNHYDDYAPYFDRWTDEEMANTALSLCHYVDKMMMTYEQRVAKDFEENGGIRERMTAARLGTRAIQRTTIEAQDQEIARLKARIAELEAEIQKLKKEQPT